MSTDENFLARWSARKREALKPPADPAPETAPAEGEVEGELDLSFLPALEDLTPEADISLFLRKGVPENLRNAALRRMWALDPSVRDYVGDALDYAWDWNAPGGVPGGGDLGLGVNVGEMVAQIFGDPPADEEVIESAAMQQNALQEPVGDAFTPEIAGQSAGEAPLETAKVDANQGFSSSDANAGSNPLPLRRTRHGSAAPS